MLDLTRSRPLIALNPDADIPPPREFGLPAQYSEWRVNQYDAVERILTSTRRFVVICAPTGYGKSLVVAATAIMSGQRTAVLTMTKGLQDQYQRELSEVFADIRGLANYTCPVAQELGVRADTTVADAPCQCGYTCMLKQSGGCTYYDTYRQAQAADALCANYQCWMYDGRKDSGQAGDLLSGGEDGRRVGILFCDEAHDAASAISMFVGEDLSRRECLELHMPWPDSGMTVEQWQKWAKEQLGRDVEDEDEYGRVTAATGIIGRLKEAERNARRSTAGWTTQVRLLRNMKRKLERVAAMKAEDEWIVSESRGDEGGTGGGSGNGNGSSSGSIGVRFDPLNPARYAESALFRGVEKIVLVSATVRPKTAQMLGISPGDMEFIEYPSTFPVARRPVIHVASVALNYRTEQNDELMMEWLRVIDEIIGARVALGRKGLVHAVSYRRAEFLLHNSEHSWCMMTHNAKDRARVIAEFRECDGPRVLVSPSIDTGYDFAHDQARFQILAKIPFASVRDPVVKARQARDPDHNLYEVAQTIVQACGRIVRAESDWGETLVVDDALAWSFPRMRAKGYLPRWFLDAFRSVEKAPEPLQL